MPELQTPVDGKLLPLKAALDLNRALAAAAVRFCHWKSNDHLAEALAGKTDIDMFVAPADRQMFEDVLARQGIVKIRSQPWASYPDVEDWLAFDAVTGGLLHLHVHYALITGLKRVKHLLIPWQEILLCNLRIDGASGWPVPAAEMELIMLLVRIWAKMPPQRRLFAARIPPQIVKELNWLRASADAARVAQLMSELGLAAETPLVTAILERQALHMRDIVPVSQVLYGKLREHRRMSWSKALGLAVLRNGCMIVGQAGRKLQRPWQTGKTIPQGGLMIAFVGTDGAGKSTVTRDVCKWLRFKLDVHLVYMGSGDGGTGLFDWMRRGIRAVVQAAQPARRRGRTRKSAGRPRPLGFLVRLVELHQLAVMRHKIKLLRRSRRLAQRGSIVITDRYPQKQVFGISDGPKLQNGSGFDWAARLELRMYDEAAELGPDVLIKLMTDPETAFRRKPDHDPDTISRKCEVISQLSFARCEVVEIDARPPYDEVLLAAKRAIWSRLIHNSDCSSSRPMRASGPGM